MRLINKFKTKVSRMEPAPMNNKMTIDSHKISPRSQDSQVQSIIIKWFLLEEMEEVPRRMLLQSTSTRDKIITEVQE